MKQKGNKVIILFAISICFIIVGFFISTLTKYEMPWSLYQIAAIISIMLISIGLIASIILGLVMLNSKLKERQPHKMNMSIDELRQRLLDSKKDEDKNHDILELMLENMLEIKQYYSMSKQQARLSFFVAIVFCVFGLIVLLFVIIKNTDNSQVTIIGIIGSTVCELFAGTALLVHKSAILQLNHYYKALHENERFLSTVHLVSRLSKEKQDEAINKIIVSSLADISNQAKID